MKYVVDTCVINWLLDRKIAREDLPPNGDFLVTYVQVEELNRTAGETRRLQLFLLFAMLHAEIVITETADWGVAPFGMFKLGTGQHFESLRRELDARVARASNKGDALIAEVALANGHTLLTADRNLAEVVKAHGGLVKFFGS